MASETQQAKINELVEEFRDLQKRTANADSARNEAVREYELLVKQSSELQDLLRLLGWQPGQA